MKYQVNNCGNRSLSKSSSPIRGKLLELPSVKKARESLPAERSESSFQQYDKTDYYQWHYRGMVYWHAVGPLLKIKGKRCLKKNKA